MQKYMNIIYLIACAINKKDVNEKLVEQMNLDYIYEVCIMQRISACLYPALKNIPGVNSKP